MWDREVGIDSFSYYTALTSKQKAAILEKLKERPRFHTVTKSYVERTYAYLSDCFSNQGVKIWVRQKYGKPWGLLIVVHPMLALGGSDRSALYQPQKKEEYQGIIKKIDKLLSTVGVPSSVDKMKLYRVDVTSNLFFDKGTLQDEYMRILKKSALLPHYQPDSFREEDHKAKNCKLANRHSHKQYCKSAAFFAYDKTAQLEMIDAFPDALIGKHILRLEAQLRRKAMKKWVGAKTMDGSNWSILKKLGENSTEILHWYLNRLQPAKVSYIRYCDAAAIINRVKSRKNRERMQFLLRKTSDSESLTAALEKLRKEYGLNSHQCRSVLKKFEKLGISPITLRNNSDYTELPPLLWLH